MNKFVINLDNQTSENTFFRKVILTTQAQQLVLMHLNPQEEIGAEIHENIDQFIKVESGEGKAILNGEEINFSEGFSVSIPAGTNHNIINTSLSNPLKIYTIYSPPEHKDGTIHRTKQEALESEEHF